MRIRLFRISLLLAFLLFSPGSLKAQEKAFSLAEFTKTFFEHYYNKTDFADPYHETGWFRADDFLHWVEQEGPELENIFIQHYKNDFVSYPPQQESDMVVLGGFLGTYYTASHCTAIKNIYPAVIERGMSSTAGTFNITIAGFFGNFITFIESGIHEGAHMLPYLCAGIESPDPSGNLSELISISAELTYGLPIKVQDNLSPPQLHQVLNRDGTTTYAQRLLVLLQYDAVSNLWEQKQARHLFPYKLEKNSFSINDLLTDLIDLQAQHLTADQEPLSLRQYLQLVNVLPQKQDRVAAWLEQFMADLNQQAKLPKSRHSREWNTFSDSYEKYLEKHQELIRQLLLKHTASFQTAPYPKGYN